jgi:hypothetical protein
MLEMIMTESGSGAYEFHMRTDSSIPKYQQFTEVICRKSRVRRAAISSNCHSCPGKFFA